jgi:hypothetical protein
MNGPAAGGAAPSVFSAAPLPVGSLHSATSDTLVGTLAPGERRRISARLGAGLVGIGLLGLGTL